MKKDAYYFSHDANAHDDDKCILLIEHLGMEGYGIFWLLIEFLRNQSDFKYNLQLLPALARRFNTDIEKVNEVVYNYKLFIIDGDMFFSESLNGRMGLANAKREAGKIAANKRWNNRLKPQDKPPENANPMPTQCEPNATALPTQCNMKGNMKGNMKYENEIKVSKSAKNCDPPKHDFFDDIIEAFKSEYLESRKEAYLITAIGKERAAVSRIFKAYKANEVNKGKDTQTTLTDFKNFFKSCMEIQEDWIFNNMTLSIISSKLNEIKSYIRSKNANPKPTYKPSGEQSDYQKRRGFDINSVKRSYEERQRDGYSTPLLSIVEDTERTAFN